MNKLQLHHSQQKYFTKNLSEREMTKDWILSKKDKQEISKYQPDYQAFIAAQLCSLRLYGSFLNDLTYLSSKVINYINIQLNLLPSITIAIPQRKRTYHKHLLGIMNYLGFQKFNNESQKALELWVEQKAHQGQLPAELLESAQKFLIYKRILLPGKTVLERLVKSVCAKAHQTLFREIYLQLTPELKQAIDGLLTIQESEQRSYFNQLKAYPPSATISSLNSYLARYKRLVDTGINQFNDQIVAPGFLRYLFRLSKAYSVTYINRFQDHKRYAMMVCFLIESRKVLLDQLVKMHDQYLMDLSRCAKNAYEKKYRTFRSQHKKALEQVLNLTETVINWPEESIPKVQLWQKIDKDNIDQSISDIATFQRLEECGYGELLLARYTSLRKYFSKFIKLPFASEPGSEVLMHAIETLRKLDAGQLKYLPDDVPTSFVPRELRRLLWDKSGKVNRNAWEMGLALAIKDALRAGDLYLPESKQHVSFWELVLSQHAWSQNKEASFEVLQQPEKGQVKDFLIQKLADSAEQATRLFKQDKFAEIQNGKLCLKSYERLEVPDSIHQLQKAIDERMPTMRIEQLLMEVDKLTRFSDHFIPIQQHGSRPANFYKTLMASIISQATNLGVVAMGASVKDISIDMLRHVLYSFINEDTLRKASAAIVEQHHKLPLSSIHGSGTLSSSDAQRFKIRADSLLASYYPRYYGYYEKAIGIYTHVSDQYTVFHTNVISCSPREALYVLDGLLENNTILKIKEHTTDTHGYTEIVFALCYLLGFYFMPRIKGLKDQQLYGVEKQGNYGAFSPLMSKTVDLNIIEEQWESMIRVAISLKQRTCPAHLIVQRLTSSSPSDRLSKAFTNLGRIIKTEYILNYLSDLSLRRKVQLQLNKGEYRHKLARWIFFANQGEFTTGDYEEIMNKASCLSLVSNAILYWNTVQINQILESIYKPGEAIDQQALEHISLLPFKHVLPHGTYFIEDL